MAADLAAVLHEHGLSRRRSTDVAERIRALRSPGDHDRGAVERARNDARRWRGAVRVGGRPGDTVGTAEDDALGLVLALGFPDRIGRARPVRADGAGRGEVLLANGRGAFLEPTDPLAAAGWLVVAELDGQANRSRVYEAAAVAEADIRAVAADAITTETEVGWDDRAGDVVARSVERLGAITLTERPVDDASPEALAAALVDGIRSEGAALLPWDDDARRLQARLSFLHRLDPDRWPDVADATLVAESDDRIGPMLVGMRRRRDLRSLDLREVLQAGLDWRDRNAIDDLAPERLPVPSGNRHRVDYTVDPPVLAVKLQEVFGATETPTVGGGRVPVVLHLLSPAGRPLQVTQDLPSFWRGAYAEVRADMRGRYPKHPWPEDPLTAAPTARTKRR